MRSEWPSSRSLQVINAGEGMEQREPSYTVGGNKLVQRLWRTVWRFSIENSMEVPYKTKNRATI